MSHWNLYLFLLQCACVSARSGPHSPDPAWRGAVLDQSQTYSAGPARQSTYKTGLGRQSTYSARPSLNEPLELVHFELMDEGEDMDRNKYDLERSRAPGQLPLLSRGERETGFDEFLDGEAEPSCKELRKMWRLAKKIHNKALETNEIPKKIHPFSSFQADRFRSSRRLRAKQNKLKGRENSRQQGNEEEVYGSVSYTPADTVKRPRDPLRKVQTQLHRESHLPDPSQEKNLPAWGEVRYYETTPKPPSSLEKLFLKLRQSEGKPPRQPVSRAGDVWGTVVSHKPYREPSSFDRMRESIMEQDGTGWLTQGTGRQGNRDHHSGTIQTGGIVDKPRGQGKKHLHKPNKNNKKQITDLEKDLLSGFRSNIFQEDRKSDMLKKKQESQDSEFYKNVVLKG